MTNNHSSANLTLPTDIYNVFKDIGCVNPKDLKTLGITNCSISGLRILIQYESEGQLIRTKQGWILASD